MSRELNRYSYTHAITIQIYAIKYPLDFLIKGMRCNCTRALHARLTTKIACQQLKRLLNGCAVAHFSSIPCRHIFYGF